MLAKQKFQIFFPEAKCYKVGNGYAIYIGDLQKYSEGSTAQRAWSNAWYPLCRDIMNNLRKHFHILISVIETHEGWSLYHCLNGTWEKHTWLSFRDDPELSHLWSDIPMVQSGPKPVSVLDLWSTLD